jgi:DNA-binding response OmpR family regulator
MREVTRWGIPIHLTPLEFDVLAHLARKRGRWVSATELLEAVWQTPANKGGTTAQVKNCIKRIRQKIEPDEERPRYL